MTKAIEDSVSFVVFAGDLYDGDRRDYNTGIFFAMQMGRLAKAGIRAFVLHGNHDAESEMTKKLVLPDSAWCRCALRALVYLQLGVPAARGALAARPLVRCATGRWPGTHSPSRFPSVVSTV
ncbi:metallophosphoesterase family protein [Variovorax paradoxus]|uniref:metallophosphoesterase family protein n=1 Tax=Variovorax paradoxus TaxID=34073 RepID=UPI0039AFF202